MSFTAIQIAVTPAKKDKFNQLCKAEGATMSAKIRLFIEEYINEKSTKK